MSTRQDPAARPDIDNMGTRTAANRRYDKSPKGRARRHRYKVSAKGRATQSRYERSDKGKATQWRYDQSMRGMLRRESYRLSPAFIKWQINRLIDLIAADFAADA